MASIDETINFTVKSSTGVDRVVIKVLSEDSGISIIADEVIKKSAGLTSTLITTSKTVFAAGWEKFHVLAYDGSSQVVSTFRSMRYIPNPIHYLTFSKGLNWTWNPLEKGEEEQKFIAIFNKDSPAKHGWNVVNETMVIGDGLGYENLVDSALSFFVSIPPADQLAADPGCVRPYRYSVGRWIKERSEEKS